jgi:hypothetical protein
MTKALWLLAVQGLIGAFDTLYFHEWRARLPALGDSARPELRLHAARSFIYAIIFGTLPWIVWQGGWTLVLGLLLAAEIVITLNDFIVEDRVRKPLGGVYSGERVTHGVMGIIYGAMLAFLLPVLLSWSSRPTTLLLSPAQVVPALRWALGLMACGVFLSGARDLCAALRLPHSEWPWSARTN